MQAISNNPGVRVVKLLDSPGGDYDATINITHEIRRRGLETEAQGFCRSACAVMFLGGVKRRLADSHSYVAFHGHYKRNHDGPSAEHVGELAELFTTLTDGKLSDELLDLMLHKPRKGFVYFFRERTFSCNGDKPKRPSGCTKLPVTALDVGVITSLDGVPEPQQ